MTGAGRPQPTRAPLERSPRLPDSRTPNPAELAFVSVAGPEPVELALKPPGPYTIGRRAHHDIVLLGDDHVSRDHASLVFEPARSGGKQWAIRDAGSRHGTWINGVRLEPARDYPIRAGDIVTIAPWSFRVTAADETRATHRTTVATLDDSAALGATIQRIDADVEGALEHRRLGVLLDCAAAIHATTDSEELSEAVLDAAMKGTGFANVALLRATGDEGLVEVVGQRGDIVVEGAPPRLSRSLIREASLGLPARLVAAPSIEMEAMSIMQYAIEEALCVPLQVGATVAGYLYFDNRGASEATRRATDDSSEFAIGLGRLAAMAMANQMRMELDRRLARVELDLDAAAEAQRYILPRRNGRYGAFSYVGESRPGQRIGGDFFDVIPLRDGRLAVALGDVSGKGVPASVLVTATQGFLHAALLEAGDPAAAINALNAYVNPRRPEDKFVTVWVGVLDADRGTLTYVNAGHGYALVRRASGEFEAAADEGGPPIGIVPDMVFTAGQTRFAEGDRLIVYSDGLYEQPAAMDPGPGGTRGAVRRFGEAGVQGCLKGLGGADDLVRGLFQALEAYAGGSQFEDDATVVEVRR